MHGQKPLSHELRIFFFFFFFLFLFLLFRCVLASLWEGVSVPPSVRPSVHPSVRPYVPHTRVEFEKWDFWAELEQDNTRNIKLCHYLERPLRYKYASRSPELIWCLNSFRLLLIMLLLREKHSCRGSNDLGRGINIVKYFYLNVSKLKNCRKSKEWPGRPTVRQSDTVTYRSCCPRQKYEKQAKIK